MSSAATVTAEIAKLLSQEVAEAQFAQEKILAQFSQWWDEMFPRANKSSALLCGTIGVRSWGKVGYNLGQHWHFPCLMRSQNRKETKRLAILGLQLNVTTS